MADATTPTAPAAPPVYPVKRLQRSGRQRAPDLPPATEQSILRDLAASTMTGLHTVGSILSTPSRLLWGTANALSGGQGGFGNLNPLDSTGGIELSKFLENQGVFAANDPNKWEVMDFVRPVIDIAGDPTSYLGFGALTRAGKAASKIPGGLTGTISQQIRRGDRALLGAQLPFSARSVGVLGTGKGAAKVAETTGRAGQAVLNAKIPGTQAQPLRWLRSKFDWTQRGMRTAETQADAPQFSQSLLNARRGNSETMQGVARTWQQAGTIADKNLAEFAMGYEQGVGRRVMETDPVTGKITERLLTRDDPGFFDDIDPSGGLGQMAGAVNSSWGRLQAKGIPRRGDLEDVIPGYKLPDDEDEYAALVGRIGELASREGIAVDEKELNKVIRGTAAQLSEIPVTPGYLPRSMDPGVRKVLERGAYRGKQVGSAEVPSNLGRNEMLKGIRGSRTMIDAIVKDADADSLIKSLAAEAESPAQQELREMIASAKAAGVPDDELADLYSQLIDSDVVIGQVADTLRNKFSAYVIPEFADPLEKGVIKNRFRVLAKWMIDHPEIRNMGVYGSDITGDVWRYLDNNSTAENAFDFAANLVRKHGQPGKAVNRPTVDDAQVTTVRSLFGELGVSPHKAAEYMAGDRDAAAELLDSTIPKHIADDLLQFRDAFRPPTEMDVGRNAYQRFTSLFKAGVLSFPARIIRDAISGQARNFERGWLTRRSLSDADHLLHGRTLRDYAKLPAVQQWLTDNGVDVAAATDEDATEALRRMLGSYLAQSPSAFSEVADAAGSEGANAGLNYLLRSMPGTFPSTRGADLAQGFGDAFRGLRDPLGIPGVRDIPEATFGPVAVAQRASEYTDYMNRATAFLEKIRQGESDLPSIFRDIDAAQVSYDPKQYTPTERQLKALFPFYRFYSQQVPYVLTELSLNPGGRLATTIKTSDRASSGDPSLPDAALSGTSIPLSQSPDGTKAFLTGLGLMHELPAELLGQTAAGDFRSAGYNALSMLNPLVKGPLEGITGQSFFRDGEALGDLDPLVGRILSNAAESVGLRESGSQPVYFPGSAAVDQLISNSPLARVATSARVAADPRRNAAEKALMLGTGARITRQSPEAQRKILKRRLEKLAESEGARMGEHGPFATPEMMERNPRLGEVIALRRKVEREVAAARKAKAGGSKTITRRKAGQPAR